jgi:hypothetical protein
MKLSQIHLLKVVDVLIVNLQREKKKFVNG